MINKDDQKIYEIILIKRIQSNIPTRINVRGYSMVPFFFPEDKINIDKCERSVNIGDVVLFYIGSQLVVHRVVNIMEEWLLTKGDNNTWFDDRIHKRDILGIFVSDHSFISQHFISVIVGYLSFLHGKIHQYQSDKFLITRICSFGESSIKLTMEFLGKILRKNALELNCHI